MCLTKQNQQKTLIWKLFPNRIFNSLLENCLYQQTTEKAMQRKYTLTYRLVRKISEHFEKAFGEAPAARSDADCLKQLLRW